MQQEQHAFDLPYRWVNTHIKARETAITFRIKNKIIGLKYGMD